MFIANSLFTIFFFCASTSASRILVFMPLDNWSHFMQYELLYETLAARGHHITLYSPYPPRANRTNFESVYISNDVFEYRRLLNDKQLLSNFAIEDQGQLNWSVVGAYQSMRFALDVNSDMLNNPVFHRLIQSEQKFDLLMIEAMFYQQTSVILSHIFKCPVIQLSSVAMDVNVLHTMSSPNVMSITPELNREFSDKMTLVERLQNVCSAAVGYFFRRIGFYVMSHQVAKYIGPEIPPVENLLFNSSFCFLYSNEALNYPFPVAPNIAQVGGIHILRNKDKTIPQAMKKVLDDAKEGFIWFSLGSVIVSKIITPEQIRTYLKAFRKTPYKVIWKFDEPVDDLPSNVLLTSWLPQMAVLAHPNCKLFITHGGLSSQLESIYFGVPVISIPYFGDQFRNAQLAEKFGFGVTLKHEYMEEEDLTYAIKKVTRDPKFKENAMQRSILMRDQYQSPLDTAVYWTEYVLQHKGTTLTPVSKDLFWFQYYLLDILAVLAGVVTISVTAVVMVVLAVIRCLRRSVRVKVKMM